MEQIGFRTLIAPEHRSNIITSFLYPNDPRFGFRPFYDALKARRFVIYPGKVSHAATFRIGTIGHVFPDDVRIEGLRGGRWMPGARTRPEIPSPTLKVDVKGFLGRLHVEILPGSGIGVVDDFEIEE